MPRESVGARTARLLGELVEKQLENKLALGPRAGTEIVLRVLEVPSQAIAQARGTRSSEAAEIVLVEHAVAERRSQILGEHETINRLLARVPKRVRARRDIYTLAAARELLAVLDRLQAKADLAVAIDQEMELLWAFAKNPPKSVARVPVRWFVAALRRAVARKHGFAVVLDTTQL